MVKTFQAVWILDYVKVYYMWKNQYIVYIWLQLGTDKYLLYLDFAVYAVTVTSFVQCGVGVLTGLHVA
jgi:hypothetical protein